MTRLHSCQSLSLDHAPNRGRRCRHDLHIVIPYVPALGLTRFLLYVPFGVNEYIPKDEKTGQPTGEDPKYSCILSFYKMDENKLANNVKKNKKNVGILICGSGTGMNIAANKHRNIRAAQCFSVKSTKLSRLHNDANVITLGARLISKNNALKYISVFLNTKFEGGRHLRRVKKI